MTKYKLLKDLPLAKAGEIVSINEKSRKKHLNEIAIMSERGTIAYVHKHNIGAWLEEIWKPKSVWELKEGDDFYTLPSLHKEKEEWGKEEEYVIARDLWLTFLSVEEAEKAERKIKAIANILKYCYENNIDTSWKDPNYEDCCLFWFNLSRKEADFCLISNIIEKPYSPLGYFSTDDAETILKKFPEELKMIYS